MSPESLPVCRSKCRNRCSPSSAVPHRAEKKIEVRCSGSSAKCFVFLMRPVKWSHWCFTPHMMCMTVLVKNNCSSLSSLEHLTSSKHVYIFHFQPWQVSSTNVKLSKVSHKKTIKSQQQFWGYCYLSKWKLRVPFHRLHSKWVYLLLNFRW